MIRNVGLKVSVGVIPFPKKRCNVLYMQVLFFFPQNVTFLKVIGVRRAHFTTQPLCVSSTNTPPPPLQRVDSFRANNIDKWRKGFPLLFRRRRADGEMILNEENYELPKQKKQNKT